VANTLGKTLQNLPGPVLITGHTGFKGTWMTLLLQQLGISVVGYSLKPEKDSLYERSNLKGKIPEKFADIRNYKVLKKFIEKHKPSVIFHMAAQPLVLESYKLPLETFDVNVMGTANLLDAAFHFSAVKVVVVVTTDKVYRNEESGKLFIESDPLEGKDPYSASKVGTEAVVRAWQQLAEVSAGPRVVSVRAGNVIGGGDFAKNRLIPDLIKSLIKNKILEVRNPNSTRPWQHVLDPLCGYILTAEAVANGNKISTINFGPDEDSLTVNEILEIAYRTWNNSKAPIGIGSDKKDITEAVTLNLDATMAKNTLGWKPKWNQEKSVEKTIIWWKKILNSQTSTIEAIFEDINEILDLGKSS
jgi:CDP-glucose 4,6-dehydratase